LDGKNRDYAIISLIYFAKNEPWLPFSGGKVSLRGR